MRHSWLCHILDHGNLQQIQKLINQVLKHRCLFPPCVALHFLPALTLNSFLPPFSCKRPRPQFVPSTELATLCRCPPDQTIRSQTRLHYHSQACPPTQDVLASVLSVNTRAWFSRVTHNYHGLPCLVLLVHLEFDDPRICKGIDRTFSFPAPKLATQLYTLSSGLFAMRAVYVAFPCGHILPAASLSTMEKVQTLTLRNRDNIQNCAKLKTRHNVQGPFNLSHVLRRGTHSSYFSPARCISRRSISWLLRRTSTFFVGFPRKYLLVF